LLREKEQQLTFEIDNLESEIRKEKKDAVATQNEVQAIIRRFEKIGISEGQLEQSGEATFQQLELEKAALESQIAALDPDLSAVELYNQKNEIYEKNFEKFRVCDEERNEAAHYLSDLTQQRFTVFDTGFRAIAAKVKETYQILTLGGDAELEYVDKLDPWGQGIQFSVRPPGKSWKDIANLSGGEKTLSSLSLVFALHQFKPTPFYIMDEIDAALDFRNVSIIANYLRARTTNAQFIVVSLRNNMFELANRLVGIFKVEDCTSSIAIDQHPEDENDIAADALLPPGDKPSSDAS
jgi:structural maintenance of chromosome 4